MERKAQKRTRSCGDGDGDPSMRMRSKSDDGDMAERVVSDEEVEAFYAILRRMREAAAAAGRDVWRGYGREFRTLKMEEEEEEEEDKEKGSLRCHQLAFKLEDFKDAAEAAGVDEVSSGGETGDLKPKKVAEYGIRPLLDLNAEP
ncbi:hypothetical protein HPP92_021493 [Vanilla planifolia]|uniref:Protein NEGATIVE REGULATOR OF RESISTANCE n=1 Tax=Vanilla planifolia TaxID=51239 RepID=A0A835UFW7_VANPL|nr:hypothetical protein HPP92_021856 [Vanilla planifolia]KAG0463017.1 hypothetical protein HPP92_021493 [Vanilla planifolia]